MQTEKYTPWFSVDNPPTRPGVYNISCRDYDQTGHWFSYFDGYFWYSWYSYAGGVDKQFYINKAEDAFKSKSGAYWVNGGNFKENWTWRGLIKE